MARKCRLNGYNTFQDIPSSVSLNSQQSINPTFRHTLLSQVGHIHRPSRRKHSGDVHPTLGSLNSSHPPNSKSKCRETGPASCLCTMAARPQMENSLSVPILQYSRTPPVVPTNPLSASHTRQNAHPLTFHTLLATPKTFEEQGLDADPAKILLDDTPEEITTFLDPVSQ
jgi:hypothetical protein